VSADLAVGTSPPPARRDARRHLTGNFANKADLFWAMLSRVRLPLELEAESQADAGVDAVRASSAACWARCCL